jgi:hypothetical protein
MMHFKFKIYWDDGSTTTFETTAENEDKAINDLYRFLGPDLSKCGIKLISRSLK